MALRYLDASTYAVVPASAVMRLGCAAVHDHKGIYTTNWLGVRFPEGTRWDLGLLEVFFWLALSLLFRALDKRPRPAGFYPALYLFAYAAFRLAIDPLRTDRVYYAGISVDTYVCAAGVLLGLVFAWKARRPTGRLQ
jgi:phosphatidylglycerol:prolipoprotein diacylglycerol transferase